MNILDQIVETKKKEVAENKATNPVRRLEKSIYNRARPVSLKHYLMRDDLTGIIAEFKRRSPSKGMINEYADPARVSLAYMQAGASALSIITDGHYFGGSNDDLMAARQNNFCPILRKDFIIDEYQVLEARSIGADAILLIAAILSAGEMKQLSDLAHNLQMEVLFEVHDAAGIGKLPPETAIVGVNNRNLKTFTLNKSHTLEMAALLPENIVRVAESGIDDAKKIPELKSAGYNGFLIGERFMREMDPGKACRRFIKQVKNLATANKS